MKDNEKKMSSEELRDLRMSLDLTQAEMSLMMGYAAQTISTLEGGRKTSITKYKRLFIYLAAKAYKDGHLSHTGELSQKFIDSIM